MMQRNLTAQPGAAIPVPMQGRRRQKVGVKARWLDLAGAMAAMTILAGCIQVEAPSEPIVIELNINIRQEVIYRLAEDAGATIEENADIF